MGGGTSLDWTDVEATANSLARNWRNFECFGWSRAFDLERPDDWCVWYTSHRDSGLLDRSNEHVIRQRLDRFSEGDDPDLVWERHSHFAVGFVDGFSLRVFGPDESTTEAFRQFCGIQEALATYPVLDDEQYSGLEYEAALTNYREEVGRLRDTLPEGWEGEVFGYFSEHGMCRFIENRDDRGAFAPREEILKALVALGLLPADAGATA